MKTYLVLFFLLCVCFSAAAQSIESGIVGHVRAPDGASLDISVDNFLLTLGTMRHFENLQKDSSKTLLALIDTAIAGVENGEINLLHAKALLEPLKARDSSLSKERRKESFGFVLLFVVRAAEKEITKQETRARAATKK